MMVFLVIRMEIRVQSPGHVEVCDGRPSSLDTFSSQLAPSSPLEKGPSGQRDGD